jgi:hypothetical protein
MSPFFHYNATFDPEEVMRRHAVVNLRPREGYLINFLGVAIDPKFFPLILQDRANQVEDIPIPANWHADIAEWGAALRAVDLSGSSFTVMELGCGWGCWINNTGVAARRSGRTPYLIGLEGDRGHIAFAREAYRANGFLDSQVTLHHGIAAAIDGMALFPRQETAGVRWGLEPILNATAQERAKLLATGRYEELSMISLATAARGHPRVDLLHVDIQGGEADLVAGSMTFLQEHVAYLVIGTHSRAIEGRLFDVLLSASWQLEIERPAILCLGEFPTVTVDGVQGWRNQSLLPL